MNGVIPLFSIGGRFSIKYRKTASVLCESFPNLYLYSLISSKPKLQVQI